MTRALSLPPTRLLERSCDRVPEPDSRIELRGEDSCGIITDRCIHPDCSRDMSNDRFSLSSRIASIEEDKLYIVGRSSKRLNNRLLRYRLGIPRIILKNDLVLI